MPSQRERQPRASLLAAGRGDITREVDGGCPEFSITLEFLVDSEDDAVIERERQRVWDAIPDWIIAVTDEEIAPVLERCGDGTAEKPWDHDALVELAKMVRGADHAA